jgi:hypothetical protein
VKVASLGNLTSPSGRRHADLGSNAAGTSRQPELCRTQAGGKIPEIT